MRKNAKESYYALLLLIVMQIFFFRSDSKLLCAIKEAKIEKLMSLKKNSLAARSKTLRERKNHVTRCKYLCYKTLFAIKH